MRTFGYAKIVSEKFAVTYSFSSPKDFQQTPNGNTSEKFKGILHAAVKGGMKFNSNLPACVNVKRLLN